MATVTIEGFDYTYDQAIIGSDAVADILVGNDNLVRYYISGLGLDDKLTGAGDEQTAVRFSLDATGAVSKIYTRNKALIRAGDKP